MASQAPDLKSRVRAKTEHDQNVHRQLERALLDHRKAFPRGNRSPDIAPISPKKLRARLEALEGVELGRSERVESGFYTSQTMELLRP